MRVTEYHRLHDVEHSYWWHVGRLAIIKKQLQKLTSKGLPKNAKILNIGAGTGGTIPTLEAFGKVTNLDSSKDAIAFLKKSGYSADLAGGISLPYKDNEFDAVVAFDVLEHIKDDSEALNEWCRVLKPNGFMVITVPAYQWLWSAHDEAMHHFRRYSRRALKSLFDNLPVITQKASYMIVFSFPLIAAHRILLERDSHSFKTSFVKVPQTINRLFIFLLSLESKAQKWLNFPFGTSVMLIVRKNIAEN